MHVHDAYVCTHQCIFRWKTQRNLIPPSLVTLAATSEDSEALW